jgi:phosphatidylglycerophosphate synthase
VNAANLLTTLRLLAVAPAVWAVATERLVIASLLFALAVITDLADGPLARRQHTSSSRGSLFDHGTDALFVAATLAALATLEAVPWPLPALVAAAFFQYALDSRALAGRPLRTSRLGRGNGIAYYVAVGVPVIAGALHDAVPSLPAVLLTPLVPGGPVPWLLGWLLVASTLLSMADRAIARAVLAK